MKKLILIIIALVTLTPFIMINNIKADYIPPESTYDLENYITWYISSGSGYDYSLNAEYDYDGNFSYFQAYIPASTNNAISNGSFDTELTISFYKNGVFGTATLDYSYLVTMNYLSPETDPSESATDIKDTNWLKLDGFTKFSYGGDNIYFADIEIKTVKFRLAKVPANYGTPRDIELTLINNADYPTFYLTTNNYIVSYNNRFGAVLHKAVFEYGQPFDIDYTPTVASPAGYEFFGWTSRDYRTFGGLIGSPGYISPIIDENDDLLQFTEYIYEEWRMYDWSDYYDIDWTGFIIEGVKTYHVYATYTALDVAVNYYDRGVFLETKNLTIGDPIDVTPPGVSIPSSIVFKGWSIQYGDTDILLTPDVVEGLVTLDSLSPFTTEIMDADEYIIMQTISLRAEYSIRTTDIIIDSGAINTPPLITNLMTQLTLHNYIGYFLVLIITMLVATVLLVSIKAPIILYVIVYMTLTTVNTIWGTIPVYASVILYILQSFIILVLINGRGLSNE